MTAAQLIAMLKAAKPNARVVFDVEAARFPCHVVDVDTCAVESDELATSIGREEGLVILNTDAPREHVHYNHSDAEAKLVAILDKALAVDAQSRYVLGDERAWYEVPCDALIELHEALEALAAKPVSK